MTVTVVLCMGLSTHLPAVAGATTSQPNIILLVLDDIGWADVGFHGGDFPTPNIDSSVKNGVELTHMYAMPQCSPTRAALMTGRYSWTIGMQHFTTIMPGSTAAIPQHIPTLAEAMKNQGYSTHAIGKWHLGYSKWEHTPVGRGFDSYLGYLQGQTDYYNRTVGSCGKAQCLYESNCAKKGSGRFKCDEPMVSPYGPNAAGEDFWRDNAASLDHVGNYTVDEYMEEFRSIIESKARKDVGGADKPFFMYFAQQLLHIPLELPPESKYAKACQGVTGGFSGANRTTLCAMAARLDDAVAELITSLKDSGMWDNTIIWALSDNGGMTAWGNQFPASASSNWPLRGGKTTLFEGGVRSVSWVFGGWKGLPDSARGSKRSSLMHAVDIFPTLDYLASSSNSTMTSQGAGDGANVWDTIIGGVPTERTEVPLNIAINRDLNVLAVPQPWVKNADVANYTALIQWPWKIILGRSYLLPVQQEILPRSGWWMVSPYSYQPPPKDEENESVLLFNLETDEKEMTNVAASNPDVVQRMTERIYSHYLNKTVGYLEPQVNVPHILANPRDHKWTWAPFQVL